MSTPSPRSETDVLRDSQPNAAGKDGLAGDLGVSSERRGPTSDAYDATDGTRPTTPPPLPDEPPPEQHPGNPEENPVGMPPKSHDPARNPGHSHGS